MSAVSTKPSKTSFRSSKQTSDIYSVSLPFELLSSWRIPTSPGKRTFGSPASTNLAFLYECTTIGRKWAEVFFLRVFCPLRGAPFPFNATYICLPLCCQLKDAYVLYPFSSILSFSLQSLLNSFCKGKIRSFILVMMILTSIWHPPSRELQFKSFVCCCHLYLSCALNAWCQQ